MCGIIGIVGKDNVNQALYDGLTVLQHRGQDAAGIVTCDDSRLYLRKRCDCRALWVLGMYAIQRRGVLPLPRHSPFMSIHPLVYPWPITVT